MIIITIDFEIELFSQLEMLGEDLLVSAVAFLMTNNLNILIHQKPRYSIKEKNFMVCMNANNQ